MRYREPALHLALLLAVLLACGGSEERAGAVEAGDLLAQYRVNEVGASAKWQGRLVQVSGDVEDIHKRFLDDMPMVSLHSPGTPGAVQCELRSDHEGVAAAKGARVTYRCRGGSQLLLGDVLVKDCVFVPQPARRPAIPRKR